MDSTCHLVELYATYCKDRDFSLKTRRFWLLYYALITLDINLANYENKSFLPVE